MKSFSFSLAAIWVTSGERFSHVLVSLILLVDEMISSSDMIVTIGFETSDRIIFFKLEVIDKAL